MRSARRRCSSRLLIGRPSRTHRASCSPRNAAHRSLYRRRRRRSSCSRNCTTQRRFPKRRPASRLAASCTPLRTSHNSKYRNRAGRMFLHSLKTRHRSSPGNSFHTPELHGLGSGKTLRTHHSSPDRSEDPHTSPRNSGSCSDKSCCTCYPSTLRSTRKRARKPRSYQGPWPCRCRARRIWQSRCCRSNRTPPQHTRPYRWREHHTPRRKRRNLRYPSRYRHSSPHRQQSRRCS